MTSNGYQAGSHQAQPPPHIQLQIGGISGARNVNANFLVHVYCHPTVAVDKIWLRLRAINDYARNLALNVTES